MTVVRYWLAMALVLVAVVGNACFSGGDELGDMMVRAIAGQVEIHRGNEVIEVDGDESLEPQDVVVTRRGGVARVNLESDRAVMLQRSSRVRIRSVSTIEGQNGSLLGMAESSSMNVLFDGVRATLSDAIFRLDRGFGSSRAASYAGTVDLESPGQSPLTLGELFEVNVASGDLPDMTRPYALDERDAWDAEYLEAVVELTSDLDRLAEGFSRQLGGSRPGVAYFSNLVGRNDLGFMKPYLSRSAAELLVGFTIATNDSHRPLAKSFEKAFRLRDQGARWGVAATILDVRTNPLVAQLQRLIIGTGVAVADGGGPADFTLAAPDAPEGVVVDDDDGTGEIIVGTTDDDDGRGGGGNQNTRPDEPDDCADFATCTVEDIEDEIPPGPNPEPSPKDADLLDDPPTHP